MARVAFITSTFPDYKDCPHGQAAGFITTTLASLGHEMHVITTADESIRSNFGKVNVHKSIIDWNAFDLPRLTATLQQIRPQIVHISHPTKIAAQKSKVLVSMIPELAHIALHTPVLTTLNDWTDDSWFEKLKSLPLLVSSDAITVSHRYLLRNLSKFLPQAQKGKIHVVPEGTPFHNSIITEGSTDHRLEQRRHFGIGDNDKVIGFLGWIRPEKGLHELIEAMAEQMIADPETKILALGSWQQSTAHYRKTVTDLIQKHGLMRQVIISGYLAEDDVWRGLEAVDVCAFAFEKGLDETNSPSLRQALFKGIPTVAYAGDLNYNEFGLKNGENIGLIPRQNKEALQLALQELLSNEVLRKKLSRGAQLLRSTLSFDGVANSFSRLYAQLIR